MVCIYPPASSKQPFDSHLRHRACVSVTSWRGVWGVWGVWGEKELDLIFLVVEAKNKRAHMWTLGSLFGQSSSCRIHPSIPAFAQRASDCVLQFSSTGVKEENLDSRLLGSFRLLTASSRLVGFLRGTFFQKTCWDIALTSAFHVSLKNLRLSHH